MGEMRRTSIQIYQDTKEALNKLGQKGDTYDQIIKSLIKNQVKTSKK